MDISFLNSDKAETQNELIVPDEVKDFVQDPQPSPTQVPYGTPTRYSQPLENPSEDQDSQSSPTRDSHVDQLASDFMKRLKKRKIKPAKSPVQEEHNHNEESHSSIPQEEPQPEAPPSESQIENLRSILRVYISFWPDRFPSYSNEKISKMSYEEMREARAVFDAALSTGTNVNLAISAFYTALNGVENTLTLCGIPMTGLTESCIANKAIEDDVKLMSIQALDRFNASPQFRLVFNVLNTARMVYSINQKLIQQQNSPQAM